MYHTINYPTNHYLATKPYKITKKQQKSIIFQNQKNPKQKTQQSRTTQNGNTCQYFTDLQREHLLVPKLPQLTQQKTIHGSITVWLLSAASKYFDAAFLTRCNRPKPNTKTVKINCSNQFRSIVIPPTCIYTFLFILVVFCMH
uniref:Uncharacterized protein n=1 Tax=Populus davidiana TaxID=266767 RepID=A0A6M2EHY5_9ROSI